MRLPRLRKKVSTSTAALLAFLLLGGVVLAQDVTNTDAQDPEVPPAVTEPEQTNVEMSPAEMVKQAKITRDDMQDKLRRVVELQEQARGHKDIIKLNCVNEKLMAVKQLMNIADEANVNLQEALARQDEDGRYHEFGRITLAQQQVSILGTEAENCVGDDLSFIGPTQVQIERPDIPDDPTDDVVPEVPDIEPPPVASPFF